MHTKGQGNSGIENLDRTKTVPASKSGKQLALNMCSYWEEYIGMLWIISWKEKGKVKQAKEFKMVQIREHNFYKDKNMDIKGYWKSRKVKVIYKLKTQGRQQFLEVSFKFK